MVLFEGHAIDDHALPTDGQTHKQTDLEVRMIPHDDHDHCGETPSDHEEYVPLLRHEAPTSETLCKSPKFLNEGRIFEVEAISVYNDRHRYDSEVAQHQGGQREVVAEHQDSIGLVSLIISLIRTSYPDDIDQASDGQWRVLLENEAKYCIPQKLFV
jgi:hypothetical protein